jgi:serine/threonine protein kinase
MSEPPDISDSSAPHRTPEPGEVLNGKYRVESTLGAGGMGVVLLVQHIELAQRMAIKLMMPGVDHDQQAVARFLREARAAAGIQSEHVVRIFDVGTLESGAPYMVMELLRGEDLNQLLANVGRLAIKDAVDYVVQACHAIGEAHAMGIVHRDLKPSNLFLTKRSDESALVKVLDFGISKAMHPEKDGVISASLTATSAVMGSPLYMSPEQVRNAKQVDGRTDIWSLGVILHELLSGSPAFHADTLPGICAAIIADDPQPLRSIREDIPAELEAVVAQCLEKSVSRRYQTIRELMTALRPFGSSNLQLSSRPIASTLRESGKPSSESESGQDAPAKQRRDARSKERVARSPLETSAAPVASSHTLVSAANDARRRRTIGVVAGAALAVVAVTLFARLRAESPPNAVTAAPALAPVQRRSFTLVVDSMPRGADVLEGDKMLGITPVQISIDNDVARDAPRKLTVRRAGFQPYSILQGPSDDNVRVIASLVENPTEPAASASRGRVPLPAAVRSPKPAKSTLPAEPPPPPVPSAEPASPPVDIRLQR